MLHFCFVSRLLLKFKIKKETFRNCMYGKIVSTQGKTQAQKRIETSGLQLELILGTETVHNNKNKSNHKKTTNPREWRESDFQSSAILDSCIHNIRLHNIRFSFQWKIPRYIKSRKEKSQQKFPKKRPGRRFTRQTWNNFLNILKELRGAVSGVQ